MIKTKTVTGRRSLQFTTLKDILADAEAFAAADSPVLGNWSKAQIVDHVRRVITAGRDGFADVKVPFVLRVLGRLIKKRTLRKGLSPGLKLPKGPATRFFIPPDDMQLAPAMEKLRSEVERCSAPDAMTQASPFFGPMSHEEWTQLNCRHAELHFSFVQPPSK